MSGDNAGALEKLQRAYAVYQAPSLGLWYGRALERAGRLVEASEKYRQVSALPLGTDATPAFRQAQADARVALEAVTPRLAQLTVVVAGIELPREAERLHVKLDERELPSALLGVAVPVDPGSRVLKAVYGSQTLEQTLSFKEAESQTANFTFTPEPAAVAAAAAPPQAAPTFKSRLQPLPRLVDNTLSRSQIVSVMQTAQPDLNQCGRGLSGNGIASLSIQGTTGRVDAAKVKFSDEFLAQLFPSRAVTKERLIELYSKCMVRVLRQLRFPTFPKPVLDVDYAFRFAGAAAEHADNERTRGATR